MDKPKIEINKEAESPETTATQLWTILGLSILIDIVTFYGVLATFGLGVFIEEAIENLISQTIAKIGGIKLSAMDNMIGLAPIPGVTAVTVHCARKLFASKFSTGNVES